MSEAALSKPVPGSYLVLFRGVAGGFTRNEERFMRTSLNTVFETAGGGRIGDIIANSRFVGVEEVSDEAAEAIGRLPAVVMVQPNLM